MRTVKFKVYEVVDELTKRRDWIEYAGVFHQWGCDTTEADSTIGTDTVAICELADGRIKCPYPTHVQFTDKEEVPHEMD